HACATACAARRDAIAHAGPRPNARAQSDAGSQPNTGAFAHAVTIRAAAQNARAGGLVHPALPAFRDAKGH
ncbi:hypothetical protein, partial [Vandammella animalimorsus]|uniref:hypothetical protein n=1 Tax=Vandammella animalimorsus TaxID=2029117 RepID=UPI0030B8D9B5